MSTITTVPAVVTVDASGSPIVTPNPLQITSGPVLIVYQLHDAAYVFPEQGAVVVTDPGPSFPRPSNTVAPRMATLYDTVEAKADFHYTVTVQHVATGRRSSIDPTIRNEP
jgi:hypothetical protein